jgi:hypothetical protein
VQEIYLILILLSEKNLVVRRLFNLGQQQPYQPVAILGPQDVQNLVFLGVTLGRHSNESDIKERGLQRGAVS